MITLILFFPVALLLFLNYQIPYSQILFVSAVVILLIEGALNYNQER